jgi:tetratricopeptide (TPR) repeat protein
LNRLLMLQGMQGLLGSPEGQATVEMLVSLARSSGDLRERLQPRINQGVWLLVTGHCHEALAALLGLSEEVSALGDQDLTARWCCNVGIAHLRLGDADSAIFALSKARDHVLALGHLEGKAHVLGALGWAFLLSGRISRAREIAETLDGLTPRAGLDPCMLAGFLARLEARYRRFDSADGMFRSAIESGRDSFPLSAMDLVIQRMELLGPRVGRDGWEEDAAWAKEFCQSRQLYAKASALDTACRRAKA